MNAVLRRDPLWRLVVWLFGRLARHPYAIVSIVVHAVVLTLLYYFGSYVIEQKQQEAQVRASVQAASHTRTEKRVHDMEKIKELLEKSSASKAATARPSEEEVEFTATSLPKKPQELLADAKKLSKSIDDIARDIQAEELAKVLKIPKDKALEQLPPPAPTPENLAAPLPDDPAKVAEAIKQLETKARDTLVQRQKELERQDQGVGVTSGAKAGSDAQQGGESKAGDQGKSGDGNSQAAGAGNGGEGNGSSPTAGNGNGTGAGGEGGASAQGQGSYNGSSGVRAEMARFINRDIAQPKYSTYSNASWNGFDRAGVQIPSLDAAGVKGIGRVLGNGGEYGSRVFVDSWYLIGPFDGKAHGGMFKNVSYPPEQAVLLDAVYFGKGKRLLKWKYFTAKSYPLIPPDRAENSVYYGYTEVMVDQAMDVTMSLGADDDLQVWLNDKMIWAGGNVGKQSFFDEIYTTSNRYMEEYKLNEGSRRVHFNKGRNKILFKLSNGPGRVFMSMVLTK